MKRLKNILAFTSIELLIVINILWMLAIWTTSIYTNQLEKAKDSTRVKDINNIRTWIVSLYSSLARYPWESTSLNPTCDTNADDSNSNLNCIVINNFIPSLPKDKKSWTSANWSPLDYLYNFGYTKFWGSWSVYEISCWIESSLSKDMASAWDNWTDNNRVEVYDWTWWTVNTCANWTDLCTTDSSPINLNVNSLNRLVLNDSNSPIIIK